MKTITKIVYAGFGLLALGLFTVASPNAFGVVPAPDGGYPGFNTAEGQNALFSITSGVANTAVGWFSLKSDTDGSFNTAVGAGTLVLNVGNQNTGEGTQNTAMGAAALLKNITGYRDTAVGVSALLNNSIGTDNVAIGWSALSSNSTGSGNIAIGSYAGFNVLTASEVICIGHGGADVSGTVWIDGIYNTPTISGTTQSVIVSNAGQLGTIASSERFKKDIASMGNASETVLSLRPVTFHYRSDAKGVPQFGLIAEEVAKINPALVIPDRDGKPYTVRYDAVNVMLLNEFLKEHRTVQELRSTITDQQATISRLKSTVAKQERAGSEQQKQIKALVASLKQQASQIQRVSAQLEVTKPALQTVLNNH